MTRDQAASRVDSKYTAERPRTQKDQKLCAPPLALALARQRQGQVCVSAVISVKGTRDSSLLGELASLGDGRCAVGSIAVGPDGRGKLFSDRRAADQNLD